MADGNSFGGARGRIPVGRIIEKTDEALAHKDIAAARRLLLYWWEEARTLGDRQGELSVLNELVGFFRLNGSFAEEEPVLARTLFLLDELEQGESVSGATILLNCATAYKAFGFPEQAMPLYERAEIVCDAWLPADDTRFGGLYNNMALALADLHQYDSAEAAYLRAIAVMRAAEDGAAEAAISYLNLADLYEGSGGAEKIPACLDTAYRLLTEGSGTRDAKFAFTLEKCAPVFDRFGRGEIARQLEGEARRIYEGA